MYPGAGDYSYEEAFSKVIVPLAESYHPEFILASVGFDGHFLDPLTSLGLTTAGFAMMNTRLKQMVNLFVFLKVGTILMSWVCVH